MLASDRPCLTLNLYGNLLDLSVIYKNETCIMKYTKRKYRFNNEGERFSKVLSKCAFLVTISVKTLGMKMHNASIQR